MLSSNCNWPLKLGNPLVKVCLRPSKTKNLLKNNYHATLFHYSLIRVTLLFSFFFFSPNFELQTCRTFRCL